jgi:hypothetical protein
MRRLTLHHSPAQSLPLMALTAVMLFLMAGLAIDGGLLYAQRRLMQNTADSSCLAASSKLSLGNTDEEAKTAAKEIIAKNIGPTGPGTGVNAPGTLAYTAVSEVYNNSSVTGTGTALTHGIEINNADVRVALRSPATTFFMRIIGFDQYTVAARAHCNANAAGGVSPFAIARYRANPGSAGLTTDLPIPGQKFAGTQVTVYDVLRRAGSEFITNWPGWGTTGTNGYPGDPTATSPCCLYSNPASTIVATKDNPGPWTALVGQSASANSGATSFVGSVLLDLRQITFFDKLAYNGITTESSTNSLKDQVVRWILNTYPGPMVDVGQQLAWVSGVNTGTIVDEFWQRHKPDDLVTMLVYNGTVYSKTDYTKYYTGSDRVSRSPASFSGEGGFPSNCDISSDTDKYIFDGSSASPASYSFKIEPIAQPGEPGTPIVNYKLRAFLSTNSWPEVQGRWRGTGTAWDSGWQDLNINGASVPVVTVNRLDNSTWPFAFDLQQSKTADCTYDDPDPLIDPVVKTLPLRYDGAESVYLETESQDGKRRAMYALVNMGETGSNDFWAYIPGTIAYKPMVKPTGGGAVTEQAPLVIKTVGGTDIVVNHTSGFGNSNFVYDWFTIGADPTNTLASVSTPTGLSAQVIDKKVSGVWTNQLEISLSNTATVAKRYYLRTTVSYGGKNHYVWYYIEVPDPLSSSIDSFVYTLGYATFKVSNLNPSTGNPDVNTIWGQAITGMILKPEDIKTGLMPRLIPWE